jgi:hypothetical protein
MRRWSLRSPQRSIINEDREQDSPAKGGEKRAMKSHPNRTKILLAFLSISIALVASHPSRITAQTADAQTAAAPL